MQLPPKSSKVWVDIVTEKIKINFSFTAANFFLGLAKMEINSNPQIAHKLAGELYDLFVKNTENANAKIDIDHLLKL